MPSTTICFAAHLAGVFQFSDTDFEVIETDALAVEHSGDVVIGLNKELGGIRKRLVPGKPGGLRVSMRADDRKIANGGVQPLGNFAGARFGGKQSKLVKQRHAMKPRNPDGPVIAPRSRCDVRTAGL